MTQPKNTNYNKEQKIISFLFDFKKNSPLFSKACKFLNPDVTAKNISDAFSRLIKNAPKKGSTGVIIGLTQDPKDIHAELIAVGLVGMIPRADMFEQGNKVVISEDVIPVTNDKEDVIEQLSEALPDLADDPLTQLVEKAKRKAKKQKADIVVTEMADSSAIVELEVGNKEPQILAEIKEPTTNSVGVPSEVLRLVNSLKEWGIKVNLPKMCNARKGRDKDAVLYMNKTQVPIHLRAKTCMADDGKTQFYGVTKPDIQVCNVKQLVTTNGAKKLCKKIATEIAFDIKISKEIPAMIPSLACNSWSYEAIVKVVKKSVDMTIRDQRKVVTLELFNEALESYDEVRKRDVTISSLQHQLEQSKEYYNNVIEDLRGQIATLSMKLRS